MYLLEVYVTNATLNINRPFTYLSDQKVSLYCRVKVRFHNADNLAIVSSCKYTDQDIEQLKTELGYEPLYIRAIVDEEPVLSKELFDLAFWLSRTTISPLISCPGESSSTLSSSAVIDVLQRNRVQPSGMVLYSAE